MGQLEASCELLQERVSVVLLPWLRRRLGGGCEHKSKSEQRMPGGRWWRYGPLRELFKGPRLWRLEGIIGGIVVAWCCLECRRRLAREGSSETVFVFTLA